MWSITTSARPAIISANSRLTSTDRYSHAVGRGRQFRRPAQRGSAPLLLRQRPDVAARLSFRWAAPRRRPRHPRHLSRAVPGTTRRRSEAARSATWTASRGHSRKRPERPALASGRANAAASTWTAQWSDDFHHALHTVLTGEQSGYYEDFGTLADLAQALRAAYVYDGRYSKHRRPPRTAARRWV